MISLAAAFVAVIQRGALAKLCATLLSARRLYISGLDLPGYESKGFLNMVRAFILHLSGCFYELNAYTLGEFPPLFSGHHTLFL